MPTHYVLYRLPKIINLEFNSAKAELLTAPTFLRWDFTPGYFSGLYTQDLPHEAPGTALVYVYLKDDSVTPMHTDLEISSMAKEMLFNATTVDFNGSASQGGCQIITINIKEPAFVHGIEKKITANIRSAH